ncbi:MAG: hypothetical protein IKY83_10200 [Proteobacteria bacterium]|nr:hypothetical protein [Pseudomonadota bacterium]
MKRYLPFLILLAIIGCNDESGKANTCENICLDANTLMKCTANGPVGENCPYGCENNACKTASTCTFACKDGFTQIITCPPSSPVEQTCPNGCENNVCKSTDTCQDLCIDAHVLIKCTANGLAGEYCPNGCENNACKDAPACTVSCKDPNTLIKCTANGPAEETCPNGCENNACKDAPACVASCKDPNTVIKCTANGPVEENCPNGCENNACKDAPACSVSCKDPNTLIKCTDNGPVEETCPNGCENNACKDAPACVASCKDPNTLILCSDDGTSVEKTCKDGCENGHCKAVYSELPKSCKDNSDAMCLTEATSYVCSDWWNQEGGYDLFQQHCAGNRTCMDGDCIVADVTKCASDYCKDHDTLVTCQNGSPIEKKCGSGNLCIDRACRASTIKTCKADGDCAETEMCYQSFCYLKSNMALKVGDACDSATFQEYCKGDIEYKCGYDDTVEMNDCSEYNGCSTMVKQAFQTKAPIFNAVCRGITTNLSACTQPGVVLNRCYNSDDPYFPIHYSMASVCVRGSDGRMIYLTDNEETDCGNACDESTGLCPK